MTAEETLEYNKRCAEFLGLTQYKGMLNCMYWQGANYIPKGYETSDLQFHSDWNWIMEVVDGVSVKFGEAPLFKEVYQKWLYEDKNTEDFLIFRLSKEALVQAINQFLIWYNDNLKITI